MVNNKSKPQETAKVDVSAGIEIKNKNTKKSILKKRG